jgi:hypothetical protein
MSADDLSVNLLGRDGNDFRRSQIDILNLVRFAGVFDPRVKLDARLLVEVKEMSVYIHVLIIFQINPKWLNV